MEAPRFMRVGAWAGSEILLYHVGHPPASHGYLLYFHPLTRTYDMRLIQPGGDFTVQASPEELAIAVSLLPPEEIARCTAASIKARGGA